MKNPMKSTRYQIDDSTDAVYEYTAEREAGLLLFKAYRAGSRDRGSPGATGHLIEAGQEGEGRETRQATRTRKK